MSVPQQYRRGLGTPSTPLSALPHARTFDALVVAHPLPFTQSRDEHVGAELQTAPGGWVTALHSSLRGVECAWVGGSGEARRPPESFRGPGDVTCIPVTVDDGKVHELHERFSEATLWPIYHGLIVAPVFDRGWWAAYEQVNRGFAEAVATAAAHGATVWVQDHHLQLVPAMLRRLRPDVRIGWFSHLPFPPVELFAQLPWREELLRGPLGADVVGFQHAGDVDNFTHSCVQLVGATSTDAGITVSNADAADGGRSPRTVRVTADPLSIDALEQQNLASTTVHCAMRSREWLPASTVAEEYVASRQALGGALVLSEFARTARELHAAYQCNPHDVVALKPTLLRAMYDDPGKKRRRLHALRRRVLAHDAHAWTQRHLLSLGAAAERG